MDRAARPYVLIAVASILFLVLASQPTHAHKEVTSKYDYNKDIFPLLQEHCARCHSEGGPAPMSLMTYQTAVSWAEAIRDELTAGRMPPWPVDFTSPPIQGGYPISAADLDKIVVWASGGTPQGDLQTKLPDVRFQSQWKLGRPDLTIPMAAEQTLGADRTEETCEFSLPTNLAETKWVKAADLMPGTASIVRDAVISIENGPVLALWEPGDETIAAPAGAAFRLTSGAKIHLEIHYRKHFDQSGAVSDRSTVGLYFTNPPASGRELQSFDIPAPAASGASGGLSAAGIIFAGTLPTAARIIAFRPILDRAYESLNVDAITPSGTRVPLLRLLGPRPQWQRRYWLQEPVDLVSGSRIEVQATPLADYSDEPKVTRQSPLQLSFDYIPR